ncbi:hypothetical protein PR001_g25339 [Phytophthora rubi]|uniref:Uncharacterized protein n=1 Tax=Phytophthora rubi TaxID=129364 RepID=A0A6A3I8U1_9STRA|nr:hypothetical protein PR001_g25339 [Phytophthora rubi]
MLKAVEDSDFRVVVRCGQNGTEPWFTDADKVALKDFAYSFFEEQVAKYEEFIADGSPKVNEQVWKYMKSKEGTRVYVERNPIVREAQMGSKITRRC